MLSTVSDTRAIEWTAGSGETVVETAYRLAPTLAERAADVDENDRFVAGNYELLKDAGLVEAGLVDELYLFVNPTAIGTGMPVFGKPGQYASFTPVQTRQFESGMLVIQLEPRR